jgi:S-adenosylmethionine:tRNA ribosyltransferase-isomerase
MSWAGCTCFFVGPVVWQRQIAHMAPVHPCGPQWIPPWPSQATALFYSGQAAWRLCSKPGVRTSDFDFELPKELIAQQPAPVRDQSRLLVLWRRSGRVEHRRFSDLPEYLRPGDVLVLNDSRVIPARLRAQTNPTGKPVELLLLWETAPNEWWALVRPGRRARSGAKLTLCHRSGQLTDVQAQVLETNAEGHRRLRFEGVTNLWAHLDELGEVPLPPYIHRTPTDDLTRDAERYQTVYARVPGSVAAPTAGLHFTPQLLDRVRAMGVQVCCVTLHVGLATFAPVKTERIEAHVMHPEPFEVSADTAQTINAALRENRRVVAVGTTTVRVLETLAQTAVADRSKATPRPGPAQMHLGQGQACQTEDRTRVAAEPVQIPSGAGMTRLFIYPPATFRVVGALLTNFHLPRSTLLMLVSAFAAPGETRGRDLVLAAYAEAIRFRYRFFSYGDAMLIL